MAPKNPLILIAFSETHGKNDDPFVLYVYEQLCALAEANHHPWRILPPLNCLGRDTLLSVLSRWKPDFLLLDWADWHISSRFLDRGEPD